MLALSRISWLTSSDMCTVSSGCSAKMSAVAQSRFLVCEEISVQAYPCLTYVGIGCKGSAAHTELVTAWYTRPRVSKRDLLVD